MGVVTIISRAEAEDAVRLGLGLATPSPRDVLLATSLRRTASMRAPIARSTLERLVFTALTPVIDITLEDVQDVLEALLGLGDLIEARVEPSSGRSLLYLGPLRFVRRRNGDAVLIGVRPDAAPLVTGDLADRAVCDRHLTVIPSLTDEELPLLADQGFVAVSEAKWMDHDPPAEPESVVESYRAALHRQGPSGEIDGLRILDPARPTRYYRGRWRTPDQQDSGLFVARRPQTYGNEIWTVVSLRGGQPIHLLDLPTARGARGCDEAWRLQAAIDRTLGSPQEALVEGTGHGRVRVGITLPPPRWLQRRWDLTGVPSMMQLGLVAYEFTGSDAREELTFLKENLWMEVRKAGRVPDGQ